ncbi:FAD-dependent oxidoreductase [Salisediminibacterium halotolerans]|uniref:FAD-dependent oxidoreductase n=1 Tax=Salisediminibacterium halotolerans TaxID=517425 RepID=UPI000EB18E91|nr:NADPH-dependent 2,4-dienoyl-CoA reductase [Salisediminibacterium halotolerans]RLJ69649.1 2,4-dienoyl-CoA reductase [Actinophytocola xinjiangensis]RPE89707.1 2,4-dienoyl-CoA reductase [Salisediminibacterium halotolerans]TWG32543.1 2,4-dienoyl-CoA reductase [Salisediminibacterium halotolerans]GEL08988.1 2,4-dienoyl-CoA reductase [Salisediminibacterium halotolerans]
MPCDALYEPLNVRNFTFKTRVIMGSMHVGLEGMERGIERLTEFYKRRASQDVGLIVTGGAAVNPEGSGGVDFMTIYEEEDINRWRPLTDGVHEAGGAIALQLFHAGRYAYKDLTGIDPVAPSPLQSPINPDIPAELTDDQVERTIRDFAGGAKRAKDAGFDAVEIMGSEGYLINQFMSPVTNHRTDRWGGTLENRMRFSLDITRAVREAVGEDFPVLFRMSGTDLIDGSTTEEETLIWAQELVNAGADILNVGIGWHESKTPTISMKVPRKHFVPVAETIAGTVDVPVVASNRINDPRDAEDILKNGRCSLVSMARPFLADPDIVTKGRDGRFEDINTCIACNQACLDHVFELKPASCLVNPEAGREIDFTMPAVSNAEKKHIVVVGAGPAGLETARVAAERGHKVTLIDERDELGGQLNYSKRIPGKEEFYETIRYFRVQLEKHGVDVQLGQSLTPNDPLVDEADEIVIATGIVPRVPDIPGSDHPHVHSYRGIFDGVVTPAKSAIIIGGGGIACDLSLFMHERGTKSISMLQRNRSFARGIGKTTRWATIMELKQIGVNMIGEIESYQSMDDSSVTFTRKGETATLEAEQIILAAGQLVNRSLAEVLEQKGKIVHVIGGAKDALGLDAKKAIYDGTVLARAL